MSKKIVRHDLEKTYEELKRTKERLERFLSMNHMHQNEFRDLTILIETLDDSIRLIPSQYHNTYYERKKKLAE